MWASASAPQGSARFARRLRGLDPPRALAASSAITGAPGEAPQLKIEPLFLTEKPDVASRIMNPTTRAVMDTPSLIRRPWMSGGPLIS
jgi:hypothetical protein